jgi:GNAT superfamily N-acetyltransferase
MENVKEINFDQIREIWHLRLWPERKSKIEPVSIINHLGKLDSRIKKNHPFFWGILKNNEIVGVVSGVQTSATHFRSRGIWVKEDCRGLKYGSFLLQAVFERALSLNCTIVWSMPRCQSWEFYEKNGFIIQEKIDTYEFGPHYLACKLLT